MESQSITITESGMYRICVSGSLPAAAADYVQGMTIGIETNVRGAPISVLTGVLVDQTALLGVLNALYGLHRPILSVKLLSKRTNKEISMSEYNFVIVKYTGPSTASKALDIVVGLSKDKQIDLKDAVAVYKTEYGKVKLAQGTSLTAGKGLTRGGIIGLILGIVLSGGVLAWTLAGAVIGGIWGSVKDSGIKDTLVKELGEGLNVNDSALCLLITDADLDVVEKRLAHLNGNVVKTAMSDDAVAAFEKLAEDASVSAAASEEMEEE